VFLNPPWELAENMACHFKGCIRTTATTTMAMFFFFILSALSAIPLLVNGNFTKNSLLGHIFLLANRLLIRLIKKLLRVLRGPFNFGWSTLIVIFTTQL
jgi:hypothetical protein